MALLTTEKKKILFEEISLLIHKSELGDAFYMIMNFTFKIKCFIHCDVTLDFVNSEKIYLRDMRLYRQQKLYISRLECKLNYGKKPNLFEDEDKFNFVNNNAFIKFYTYCLSEYENTCNISNVGENYYSKELSNGIILLKLLDLKSCGNLVNFGKKLFKSIKF